MARYLSRENEPITKWKEIPIYLTTILTAAFVLGLLLSAMGLTPLPAIFYLPAEWTVWRPFSALTYPFFERELNFFTPLGIICFYFWGLGVETHFGRKVFGLLCVILAIVPALVFTAFHYSTGQVTIAIGNYFLTIGLVVAFATLYPNAEAWGWIPFKWLAFACLVCATMAEVGKRSWMNFAAVWANAGAAFLFIRHQMNREYDDAGPTFFEKARQWFRPKPKLRVLPKPGPAGRPVESHPSVIEVDTEIDVLLDKIAKSGLASLSSTERAKLEKARQELLKKGDS